MAPRIDAHQHFWRYRTDEYGWIDESLAPLRRDFLPGDLVPLMNATGIDACVAVQARQSAEETRWLLELADSHPRIAGVVGWIDLQADDTRTQLERWARHPKLVGVRHVVQDEPDDRFLLRPAFCRGVEELAPLGLAYDILIYRHHLPVAAEFVARFPQHRFVLDHLAKPAIRTGTTGTDFAAWARDLARLARHPHVYAKVSGLVTEADWVAWTSGDIHPYLDVALETFGAERLMIGSDWPVCLVAGEYARIMSVVRDWLGDRSAAERDAVLGGTAQRFWNLEEM